MKSVKSKITGVLAVVLGLNVAGGVVVYLGIAAQEADGVVANLTGAQRMLSQKMTKEVLLAAHASGDPTLARTSAARFDRVLAGLRKGDSELG